MRFYCSSSCITKLYHFLEFVAQLHLFQMQDTVYSLLRQRSPKSPAIYVPGRAQAVTTDELVRLVQDLSVQIGKALDTGARRSDQSRDAELVVIYALPNGAPRCRTLSRDMFDTARRCSANESKQ